MYFFKEGNIDFEVVLLVKCNGILYKKIFILIKYYIFKLSYIIWLFLFRNNIILCNWKEMIGIGYIFFNKKYLWFVKVIN